MLCCNNSKHDDAHARTENPRFLFPADTMARQLHRTGFEFGSTCFCRAFSVLPFRQTGVEQASSGKRPLGSARQHGSTFGPIPPRCVTVIISLLSLGPRLSRQDNSPPSHTQAVTTHQYHLLSPHKDNTSGSQDTGDEAFVVRASKNSAHGACWLRDVCVFDG